MPTRKTHNTADEVEVAESDELESLRLEVTALNSKLELADHNATAAKSLHDAEVKRLTDLASHLQRSAGLHSVPTTPRDALALIITKLEDVAVGGVAGDLRTTVHTATAALSAEDRHTVQEFAARLRSAAEAVDQEAATLFL